MTCGLIVAGERPSFASEKQNFASGVPTAMSHAATRAVPPANAGPCTRAMVGLGMRSSAESMSEIRASEEPFVNQFVNGKLEGPVPFHYPAQDYGADLELAAS